ncbi:g5418 [Coccomyxa elongata]
MTWALFFMTVLIAANAKETVKRDAPHTLRMPNLMLQATVPLSVNAAWFLKPWVSTGKHLQMLVTHQHGIGLIFERITAVWDIGG